MPLLPSGLSRPVLGWTLLLPLPLPYIYVKCGYKWLKPPEWGVSGEAPIATNLTVCRCIFVDCCITHRNLSKLEKKSVTKYVPLNKLRRSRSQFWTELRLPKNNGEDLHGKFHGNPTKSQFIATGSQREGRTGGRGLRTGRSFFFLTLYKNANKLTLCAVHSLFVRTFIAHFKAGGLHPVPSESPIYVLDMWTEEWNRKSRRSRRTYEVFGQNWIVHINERKKLNYICATFMKWIWTPYVATTFCRLSVRPCDPLCRIFTDYTDCCGVFMKSSSSSSRTAPFDPFRLQSYNCCLQRFFGLPIVLLPCGL